MELSEYFKDSANLVTRERIYFHKIAFDLELAAARKGYHLQLFEPEVDRDGFDIVLNDHTSDTRDLDRWLGSVGSRMSVEKGATARNTSNSALG
jgi:hypothetical protein